MRNFLKPEEQKINFEKLETIFIFSIQLVMQAYKKMLINFPFEYSHENQINDKLFTALKDLLQNEEDIPKTIFIPIAQSYDPEKRDGYGKASIEDMKILWRMGADSIDYGFSFECKRLMCNKKNHNYFNEGMSRYKEGFYAKKMPFAAMIGYLEDGNIVDIVEHLNSNILINNIFQEPIKENSFYWTSQHDRSNHPTIKLFHIFLDFRDCQGQAHNQNSFSSNLYSRVLENYIDKKQHYDLHTEYLALENGYKINQIKTDF